MTVIQIARSRLVSRVRAERARGALTRSAWLVLVLAAVLLAFGLVMILSASSPSAYQRYGSSFFFLKRQVLWAVIGVVAATIVARTDYRRWRTGGWLLLAASILGLIAVLLPALGTRVSGSSRWLGWGWARVQPSEFAKLALILVAADVVVRKQGRLATLKEIALPLGIVALAVMGLVMAQPDLGTTMIMAMILFVVLFVGSVPLPMLGAVGGFGIAGSLALAMTERYRFARLAAFANPFKDKLGSGYQGVQSLIALGGGGIAGVGLGASRQKWLYVPNAHTDFIYAIIGEELGLIGTFLVLGLFLALAYAGIRIARRAPDAFGRLVAAGITTWIVGQAIVNMGAVTGVLPITGVPLPLISFGGSALVFTLIGIGILVSIARQEQWPPPQRAAAARSAARRSTARKR